ncbi:hypothetical protein M5689_022691 [Euphorbia peplus]|nr:hypothetical protein M5689_022691 [Euphorbia peplus]
MDITGSARFRHRKTPSSDRFLAAYPRTTDHNTPSDENELNEEDIFSAGEFSESNYQNPSTSSSVSGSSSSSPRHSHLNHNTFPQAESYGILAALPDNRINSHLHQKTAITSPFSSTSSSLSTTASRFIPSSPKPPQERFPISSSSFTSSRFHHHQQPQSAPVNVPVLKMAMRRRHKEFDEIDEDDEDRDVDGDGEEMLPPHEMVARDTPLLACSVLEGVGRTLKGRDLRQFLGVSIKSFSDGFAEVQWDYFEELMGTQLHTRGSLIILEKSMAALYSLVFWNFFIAAY